MSERLNQTPDLDPELSHELLMEELEAAKKLTRLRDKKRALETLTAEVGKITDFPKSLEFDTQSLEGLPFDKQHSIINWELCVLTSWLTKNQLAAFEFKKIVDALVGNTVKNSQSIV